MQNNKKSFASLSFIILVLLLLVGEYLYLNSHRNNHKEVIKVTTTSPNLIPSVKIALLTEPQKNGDEKELKGCDLVVLVDRSVVPTQAPLTAAMKELFARKEPWPYTESQSGNFITSQKNLFFDHATIENGVAKIYLTGSYSLGGECDDPRIGTQIEETAKQFFTVNSVETYFNGKKFSFFFSEKGP